MMEEKRGFFKKRDIIAVAILLAVSGLIFLEISLYSQRAEKAIANIYVMGELYRSIDLSKQKNTELIEIDGKLHVQLEVSPGAIRFVDSQCPDKICVHAGTLTKPPQTAVCLPAQVSVIVSSQDKLSQQIDGQTG